MTDAATVEAMQRLAEQMTTAAGTVAAAAAGFDELVDERVQERVAALMSQHADGYESQIDELNATLAREKERLTDVVAELRRQIRSRDRLYDRAVAVLREAGRTEFGRSTGGVDGEPSASDPAGQIMYWLDLAVPPWPEGRMLYLLGTLAVTTNLEGHLGGNDTTVHPDARSSRPVPVGALVRALQTFVSAPADQPSAQTVVEVRNLLVGLGMPGAVEKRGETVGAPANGENHR